MKQQEMRMTGSGPAVIPPQALMNDPESEEIDTRFGKVTIHRKNPIIFPNGILGMPDKMQFCLTSFSNEKLARFKLLQSLDDMELSFITLPIDIDNPIIEKIDIQQGCKDLEMPEEHTMLLLVTTVHRSMQGVQLSVNARAPIYINTPKRTATQYVFHSTKYAIQHMITL